MILYRFATGVEDKQRRLRAFLSVMGADNPLMLQVKTERERHSPIVLHNH